MGACPTVETERLVLRPFREADLDTYTAVLQSPEVRKSLHLADDIGREKAFEQMELWLGQWELRGTGQWAVEERGVGDVARSRRIALADAARLAGHRDRLDVPPRPLGKGLRDRSRRRGARLRVRAPRRGRDLQLHPPREHAVASGRAAPGLHAVGGADVRGVPGAPAHDLAPTRATTSAASAGRRRASPRCAPGPGTRPLPSSRSRRRRRARPRWRRCPAAGARSRSTRARSPTSPTAR